MKFGGSTRGRQNLEEFTFELTAKYFLSPAPVGKTQLVSDLAETRHTGVFEGAGFISDVGIDNFKIFKFKFLKILKNLKNLKFLKLSKELKKVKFFENFEKISSDLKFLKDFKFFKIY